MPPLPDLADIEYKRGDVVWVYSRDRTTRRRGDVLQSDGWNVRVEIEYPRHELRWVDRFDLRPYSAVDQLADLIRCKTCDRRPADCDCWKFTITEGAATDATWTTTIGPDDVATNCDPITALGDLIRNPERPPLTDREWNRRRRRNWLAKRSRRRNR